MLVCTMCMCMCWHTVHVPGRKVFFQPSQVHACERSRALAQLHGPAASACIARIAVVPREHECDQVAAALPIAHLPSNVQINDVRHVSQSSWAIVTRLVLPAAAGPGAGITGPTALKDCVCQAGDLLSQLLRAQRESSQVLATYIASTPGHC